MADLSPASAASLSLSRAPLVLVREHPDLPLLAARGQRVCRPRPQVVGWDAALPRGQREDPARTRAGRRRRRTPGARGRLEPTPRGCVRLRAPTGAGPAGAGRPQAAGFGKDVFTVPRVLGYPGGWGAEFVCLRRRREEAEEPLGHKLPFPAPPLSDKPVKLKMPTALVPW